MKPNPPWHTLSTEAACDLLGAAPSGLTADEARRRLEEHGPNELPLPARNVALELLLAQFKNVLIVILLIATVISAFLGQVLEAVAIVIIVFFAIVLGFVQEYRAQRAIEALRALAAPTATLLRGGEELTVPAREVVAGDLLLLRMGDKVPADARVIESANLMANESPLTGESMPVAKQSEVLSDTTCVIADRFNMAYSGTVVSYGRGRAVVVATGPDTEFGKISGMLQTLEVGRTPLQENLDRAGRALATAALLVVVMIVALGLLRGAPWLEMLVFGIALAVAVVPEALPAVVTISLALGVQRMSRRNALIRHLPIVETLGCTSVICADKTGTLTSDEMTARAIWIDGRVVEITGSGYVPEGQFVVSGTSVPVTAALERLLSGAALACDARLTRLDDRWEIRGDPTEGALIVAAAKAGIDKSRLEATHPRIDEIPFTSESKRMTTLHADADGTLAYAKGAPEVILASCTRLLTGEGTTRELDADTVQSVRRAAAAMAADALRVLAVAYKTDTDIADAERDMVFAGLVGMIDPPRPQAYAAIETCRKAGIKPVMITGDHPATAQAIARELGLSTTEKVVSGAELEALSDEELQRRVHAIDVYARVSPEHKLRVVDAWQKCGKVVAMTGDGINDAPALKKADVGIAMGITGTDVSKEAAAMTLTDDNFASIVGAVEEGRAIFANIKKYLMYLLSSNLGEIGLIAGAMLAGMPLPLTAVQILYVNLATDGLPALALAVDPPEPDLMRRPPRDPRRGIFTRPMVVLMLVGGAWSMTVTLGLYTWALYSGRGTDHAVSITFVTLVLIQFFKAYGFRSDWHSALLKPFANRWLNAAILWEIALLVCIVYVPFLQQPLATHGLSADEWLLAGAVSATVLPVLEIAKWMLRRGWFGLVPGYHYPGASG